MKKNYYLMSDGILKRRENTVYFVNKDGKKPIPISKIYSIYAYGSLTFTSQATHLLAKEGIPIHFFNYYGYYDGSFYPREKLLSGDLIIKQAEHYLDHKKRIFIAKKFVEGAGGNMEKVLKYYNLENKINSILLDLESCNMITEVMNVEGRMRADYYQKMNEILPESFNFDKRVKRPPENMVNALISFGNSMVYSTVLSEIYNTQLNPTVSYLHEPSERRFSLALDLSEIFKPILVDRLIFYLVNKRMLSEDDFEKDLNYCLLNDKGRKTFIKEYEGRLKKTIKHRELNRKVSYRRLIRHEAYKLIKHLIGTEKYKPFVMWW